jgi:hypothetical protein
MIKGRLVRRIAMLALLSAPAFGQVLDFDAACGSPPCAAGTAYSASGIAFVPGATQIVAGGTNGLTGVNGPHFLLVAAPPYQATVTLAREATFVGVTLARATSSAPTVVVQLTALKGGAPVGSTTVTLTDVNQWKTANLSLPIGFDTLVIGGTGGGELTFGVDNLQFGGTCSSFADVSPADMFCNAAEWLANRSVTLGCAPGQFCPSQPVTRAAMALFLERLGTSLAPAFRYATDFFLGDFQAPAFLCSTSEYRVLGSPRIATANAAMIGSSASVLKVLSAQIVFSTDAGATWNAPPAGAFMPHSIDPNHAVSWMEHTPPLALESGRAYRFAVRVVSQTGYGPSDAAATARAECELLVRIENANGASAPFDSRE